VIAVFRANTKNAAVLEKHLRIKGEARIKAQGAALPTVDPSDPDELDGMIDSNSLPPEYIEGQPSQQPPMRHTAQGQTPTTNTATTITQTSGSGSGWFCRVKKSKQPDVERGAGQ
jgi:hypothetical protein